MYSRRNHCFWWGKMGKKVKSCRNHNFLGTCTVLLFEHLCTDNNIKRKTLYSTKISILHQSYFLFQEKQSYEYKLWLKIAFLSRILYLCILCSKRKKPTKRPASQERRRRALEFMAASLKKEEKAKRSILVVVVVAIIHSFLSFESNSTVVSLLSKGPFTLKICDKKYLLVLIICSWI